MDHRLILVIGFTVIIHLIITLGYSVRLAGVRTQRLALAFSLWNVIYLVSSTANTIQAPFLGRLVDEAGRQLQAGATGMVGKVEWEIRAVILAATIGTILGTIFIPTFVRLFTKGIFVFEKEKSVPKMVLMLFHPKYLKAIVSKITVPTLQTAKSARAGKGLPTKIVILNFFVTGVWTVGILAALFAGLIDINYVRTTANMSGVINGLATILGVVLVDPHVASITDEATRGLRSDEDVKTMTIQLSVSRIAGTILAQLVFVPAAYFIVAIARML